MRRSIAVVILAGFPFGCQYVEQPKKVEALEKRIDELATRVAELHGEPEEEPRKPGGDGKAEPGKRSQARSPRAAGAERPAARVAHPSRESGAEPGAAAAPPTPAAPVAAAHGAPHWGYEGAAGPAAWASLDPAFATCGAGTAQSPIDILPRPGDPPESFFVYKATGATVVDNGHTFQVDLDPGSYAVIDGARFDLIQFHVHTPSEHTIAGDVFPLEVHLVHRDKAGALAVVGVLFAEGEASPALAPVWKSAPRAAERARLKKPFDPASLLPVDQRTYRYDGSLTTPPCSEGVRWLVMRRTRTEAPAHIAAFRARFGANARPVQALGARELR